MKKQVIILFIIITAVSCRKADRDLDRSIVDCQDNGIGLTFVLDAWRIVDEACKSTSALRNSSINCAGIVYDNLQNPMLLQIDYGTSGCTASDGRTRKGKIICTLSNNYTAAGSVINMSLQHFYINNYHLEGNITFTNLGLNALMQSEYKLNATNIRITSPDLSKSFLWSCDIKLIWTSGEATTANFSDDSYIINGTTSGTNHKGNTFTANFIQSGTLNAGCYWLQNAVIEIAPQALTKRKMTYAAGCMNNVAVVVNGYEYVVELP